jgi:hypothetical protein
MLLFYLNAAPVVQAVAANATRVPVSFAIPGYAFFTVEISEPQAKQTSEYFKALLSTYFPIERGGNGVIVIDFSNLGFDSYTSAKILQTVIIPMLNGIPPTMDLESMSGKEAAVLMEYLDYLGIDPHQEFGPIQWVVEFNRRGVEVMDPTWEIEFFKYSNYNYVSLSPKASGSFLKELTTHPRFVEIERGGALFLSLKLENHPYGSPIARNIDGQVNALKILSEHFSLYSLLGFQADPGMIEVLSQMKDLHELTLVMVRGSG